MGKGREYVEKIRDIISPSGLEAIDEGDGIGRRLVGRDPANYGSIGFNAVDLSYNSIKTDNSGAIGWDSFATNRGTEAAGVSSIAMGHFSNALEDFSIAIGNRVQAINEYQTIFGTRNLAQSFNTTCEFGIGNRSGIELKHNGLEIHGQWDLGDVKQPNWGAVVAPEMTNAVIDAFPTGKVLITKEYADANYGGAGGGTMSSWFVKENNGTGSEITDTESVDFIDGIGSLAVMVSQFNPTVTFNLNYGFGSNIIDVAGNGLTQPIATNAQLLFRDAIDGIVKKGYASDLPFTNNIGDITGVNIIAGTGMTGTVDTTSGDHTQTLDLIYSNISNFVYQASTLSNPATNDYFIYHDFSTQFARKTPLSNVDVHNLNDTGVMYDDVVNGYTRAQYFEITSNTSPGANYNIDLDLNQVHTITLSANISITISNIKPGSTYIIIIKQPPTAGPYTVAWPTIIYWPDDVGPTMTATDDRADIFTFVAETTSKLYGSYNQNYNAGVVV